MSFATLHDRRNFRAAGLSAVSGAPLLFALAGLIVLLPILRLVWEVAGPMAAGDMTALTRVLNSPMTWRATGNSVAIAAGATLVAAALGVPFALLCGLTDLRGKTALAFCLILPLMIPPQIVALSWIHLAGSGSPLL